MARITYSRDHRFYYISPHAGSGRARNWLSVEKHPGPVPEERKDDVWKGWAEIRPTDGEVYHREVLGFAFWKVSSGDEEHIDARSDLYKDYAAIHGWGDSLLHRLAARVT